MQVTADVKTRVQRKIAEGLDKARAAYNITLEVPTVVYKKRGTTAGTANYRTWTIDLNPVLLMENVDAFIERTVPHELAHLITDRVYPEAHTRRFRGEKREVHGPRWRSVMRTLGVADSTRCHSYDTSSVKRSKTSYEYKCTVCGSTFSLGPKRHAKMLQSATAYRHTVCGSHARIELVQTVQPARPAVAPVARPAAARKDTGTSTKMDRCYGWYKHYKDQNTVNLRQMCIAVFVQEVGMTPAGASTYYSMCQKIDRQG